MLADRIEANGCKRPAVSEVWRNGARLLLERDGRDYSEAARLIEWCQADPFWRSVVMTMAAFRKNYDKIRLAAARPQGARGAARPSSYSEEEYASAY